MSLDRTYTIAPRYHPGYSLLGHWIRSRSADDRSAESTFLVAASTLAVALLVSQFLSWAYLSPMTADVQATFMTTQVVLAATFAVFVLAGRQPGYDVRLEDGGLLVKGSEDTLRIPLADIRRVSIISAETFYGHYARYAAVRDVVNRLHPTLLLIEVTGAPIVLGLEPADVIELEEILTNRLAAPQESTRVGAI